ncbi:hypothetical protein PGT21_008346 [Puccinia graminis f. sp. tritici]|uniref:Secreted protein n=1 Tax=Puccinia graminis f. sp. tritici TaxID=56615 RepID=A0A5B0MQY1_PUCGR|nr:hypothetical protein PGT21_008346 [Puccinia graminis f. sp. tritici]
MSVFPLFILLGVLITQFLNLKFCRQYQDIHNQIILIRIRSFPNPSPLILGSSDFPVQTKQVIEDEVPFCLYIRFRPYQCFISTASAANKTIDAHECGATDWFCWV